MSEKDRLIGLLVEAALELVESSPVMPLAKFEKLVEAFYNEAYNAGYDSCAVNNGLETDDL